MVVLHAGFVMFSIQRRGHRLTEEDGRTACGIWRDGVALILRMAIPRPCHFQKSD